MRNHYILEMEEMCVCVCVCPLALNNDVCSCNFDFSSKFTFCTFWHKSMTSVSEPKKILLFFATTKITKSDIFSRNIYKLIRNICTYNYLQTINLYLNNTALSLFSGYQFTFIISSQVVVRKTNFCHPQNYPKK